MNYWIFQANPDFFNIKAALKHEDVSIFNVTAHKSEIKKGDKFILWVTGGDCGCYALGEVLSDVEHIETGAISMKYWIKANKIYQDKVQVKITHNFHDQPIFKDKIPQRLLKELNVSLPGTNFRANEAQFNAVLKLIEIENVVKEPLSRYEILKPVTANFALNTILYGPPGTGKTYKTINYAVAIIENKRLEEIEAASSQNRVAVKKRFDEYVADGQIAFVTFHQSMSYEDFVEGIKPKTSEDKSITYEIKKGLFLTLSKRASTSKDNHVLIIDEINRGNIAGIFGELITLLETDKRANMPEALTVSLPYSKSAFAVPANLYLIGTMNTADRSTEAIDAALRRRFEFVPLLPEPKLLGSVGKIDLSLLLNTINERIELLLDRDYCIGHAYLWDVKTISDLSHVFSEKIIPLLQEYFFNDWGKIGLILGKAFVRKRPLRDNAFADFYYEGSEIYEDKLLYEVTSEESWEESTFLSVLQ